MIGSGELVTSLECDDCGDTAISEPTGVWVDGDAAVCECGTRWLVSVDTEERDVYLVRIET